MCSLLSRDQNSTHDIEEAEQTGLAIRSAEHIYGSSELAGSLSMRCPLVVQASGHSLLHEVSLSGSIQLVHAFWNRSDGICVSRGPVNVCHNSGIDVWSQDLQRVVAATVIVEEEGGNTEHAVEGDPARSIFSQNGGRADGKC